MKKKSKLISARQIQLEIEQKLLAADIQAIREKANLVVEGTGATRSAGTPKYRLVPPEGIDCITERFELGAPIHGAFNWMNDMTIDTILDHIERHVRELRISKFYGNTPSAWHHFGAIGWGAMVGAWFCVHKLATFIPAPTPAERHALALIKHLENAFDDPKTKFKVHTAAHIDAVFVRATKNKRAGRAK